MDAAVSKLCMASQVIMMPNKEARSLVVSRSDLCFALARGLCAIFHLRSLCVSKGAV